MNLIKKIESLSSIVDQYEIFIIDQWGVMHNGKIGYPHAIKCISNLIKLKKKLIIISNSSKRKQPTIDNLPKLGFAVDDFIEVITSGELIWQNLYSKSHDFIKNLGRKCYHLTDKNNKESAKYIEGLDYDFVEKVKDADFILGCTTFPGSNTLDYVPLLEKAIQKKLPFVCANPDFESIDSPSKDLVICMGTVAELYKSFGGLVFMMGKPSKYIYEESIKNIKKIDKAKILAVGDSIHHDIKGANLFDINSLFITSGIHKSNFDQLNPKWDDINNNLTKLGINPTYLCSKFQF